MSFQPASGFIPVNGAVLANTHGSPNQGAFIPAGPLAAQAAGYITTQHGAKGHHTVVHPVIIQQAPPPPPPPQTIIREVPVPMPVPVPTPVPAPAAQPAPVNIRINNTQPAQDMSGAAAPAIPQRPGVVQQQQTTSTTTTTAAAPGVNGGVGGSVYDPANGATVTTAGEAGPIPRQTNVTSTTTTTGM